MKSQTVLVHVIDAIGVGIAGCFQMTIAVKSYFDF